MTNSNNSTSSTTNNNTATTKKNTTSKSASTKKSDSKKTTKKNTSKKDTSKKDTSKKSVTTTQSAKVDNSKYKHFFGCKAKMLSADEVEPMIGHAIGGVCSFGINEGVKVYLDVSLKRFTTFFPACGSSNSAIELTPEELEKYSSNCQGWVDLCKGWQE